MANQTTGRYRWKDEGLKRLLIEMVRVSLEDLCEPCTSKFWYNVCDYAEAYLFVTSDLGEQVLEAIGIALPHFEPCPHVAKLGRISPPSKEGTNEAITRVSNLLLSDEEDE